MSKKLSAVVNFVLIAKCEAFSATDFTRERALYPAADALKLTIKHGFKFEKNDIADLIKAAKVSCDIESIYSLAVGWKNIGAAISIEHFLDRKPFIFTDVKCDVGHGRLSHERRQRIVVGASFKWRCRIEDKEFQIECTSFSEDHKHITACAYDFHPDSSGHWQKKIKRRFKITRKMILAEDKRLRSLKSEKKGL